MNKSISVYIPTCNRPGMLDRALASLTRQSYRNFQVLVCNDGSRCSYAEVIEKYRGQFMDFQYVENAFPRGACFSRNRLIHLADGEYITGLDDDDEFLDSRLETFINSPCLQQYAFLCAGHLTRTSRGLFRQPSRPGPVTLHAMLSRNLVGNQVFTPTEYLRRCGGFDEDFPAWQDYDTWLRLSLWYGDGYMLPEYTYQMNVDHEDGRISSSWKARRGYELFVNKHREILSSGNIRSLYFQDIINRNDRLSWPGVIEHFSLPLLPMILKYQLKKMVPGLKEKIYKA
ncbi:glycosyltransferase [Lelliottia sp. V106_10]|uniref:glycosyltransferase n=1 Tax=Lelliottia wanjuensis TaxID=3050585 RepID=UPI00254F416E|nr:MULTISPECIES: glycosyltransferase [unclassified Lelliottia]MDK9358874.1 glycosyltransferase [Lelliottia sp. V106_16]MDK9373561.1 glycosyltransferase [Lelliottia sp. V106_10]MDK9600398.1 glycosyltransferase [Lelliottia sp. V106_5]